MELDVDLYGDGTNGALKVSGGLSATVTGNYVTLDISSIQF